MKLQPDRFDVPSVTAYGDGWLAVNGERFAQSVLLGSASGVVAVNVSATEGVNSDLIAQALGLSTSPPEVLLIGTGSKHQRVHPRLLQSLMAQRVGAECMDTQAACRTYNILVGEGRRVSAILLV